MDPENGRYDVFISYSHRDKEKYGQELIPKIKQQIENDLSKTIGRSLVFLDSEALGYGDEWHAKIMEKLNECRVFVCLLSENYFQSTYCTRERLIWEKKEIQRGRLRQATLPVYFIRLNKDPDPLNDDRRQVRDLFGFQMMENAVPWFDRGMNEVKALYLKERIKELKNAVHENLSRAITAETSFNTVFPEPSRFFVGRIVELKEIREICACNQYPVIEGGAGVGKSELATVYAYGYADEYPQGRFLIHMEGKKKWEEAVVSLVKDPETGKDVQEILDIPDEKMGKSDAELHRLIIKNLFARAETGRLLLLLDNVDDASLFKEQKLQDFSRKRPIPDNIHMIATTRHEFELSNVKLRARSYHIDNLDDDASFELFCEIGDNQFPFCTRPILEKESDPEYNAVMEIIHLLEGHVWSMEIIAGQIAGKYRDGVTFRKKLNNLKKNFSIKGDGQSRSLAETPADLVQGTLDILKNVENGYAIISLAYFAALLLPDSRKKDVLRACWDKLFADVEFEIEPEDVFIYAYRHLWHYNLIHGEKDDKMHRLTQAALKQIMKDNGIFEECVGKLADIMVGTLTISNETWIDTVSATPEIAAYLKKAHPEFFSTLFTPKAWIRLMSCDPPQPFLVEICPWNTLNSDEWETLLETRPQFADKCPWDQINISWVDLLPAQPKFGDKCPWDKLDPYDVIDIICHQPWFADKCPWDKLSIGDWTMLLEYQPDLAIHHDCPLDKMTGLGWMRLLKQLPRFADQCPWDKLDGTDWAELLSEQPKFADKCPWDKLESNDWMQLLQKKPQFADRCPWNKMESPDWAGLLREQPGFADKCPWNKLESDDWMWLLKKQPGFADKCPWDKLAVKDWPGLLQEQPQFANRCPWDKLIGKDWSALLQRQPQFADKCPWDKLNGENWSVLLPRQPQFADKCPWDKLNGENWSVLLQAQPKFADRCPWNKLMGKDWERLLISRPLLAGNCDWDKLDGENWALLLGKQPGLSEKCSWNKLGSCDWFELLHIQPQFAEYCDWNKLDGYDWTTLLLWQPQFAKNCDWDKLDEKDWERLLANRPQFAEKARLFRKE
jgi:hypothetical protein